MVTVTETGTAIRGVRRLDGRVAIVTGASRGIGAAIARELAAEGADLVINYASSAELAEKLKSELESSGHDGNYVTARADISDVEQVRDLMRLTQERFGRIDILINNAGITRDRTFRKMTPEEWGEVINTNLTGVFNCMHAATPYLIEQGGGKVITISSVIALSGNIGQANYAAAKAGIIGLTKTLALEWARYNITVNCVAPGFIETDMLAKVPDNYREQLYDRIPLHRFGKPEEVARAVRFLCADGDYITGEVISVNGGLYM